MTRGIAPCQTSNQQNACRVDHRTDPGDQIIRTSPGRNAAKERRQTQRGSAGIAQGSNVSTPLAHGGELPMQTDPRPSGDEGTILPKIKEI